MKKSRLSKFNEKDTAELDKLSLKQRSKASYGKPDQSDIDNLNRLFHFYNKYNPGKLQKMQDNYRTQQALKEYTPKPKGVKSSDMTMAFWMPQDLQQVVEQYFPTIWTNKEHLEWFLDHFPFFKA